MHVKSKYSAEHGSRSLKGHPKTYMLSLLNKASVYAGYLVSLLKEQPGSESSSEAILEARAYQIGLCGAHSFEKHDWEKSLQQYAEARLIYTTLASEKGSKGENLFRDLLSTTIDPSIRYAAYRLKIPRTTSIDSIVVGYSSRERNEFVKELLKRDPKALNDPRKGKEKIEGEMAGTALQTIEWRSRRVKLEDASTAQALGAVRAAEGALAEYLSSNEGSSPQTKAAAYDQVLLPSQDAVDATKTAIDELAAEGVSQGDQQMQSLQVTRTAVNYALIKWRIGRNRILCGGQDGAAFDEESPRAPKYGRDEAKIEGSTEESTGHKIKRLREQVVLYDSSLQSFYAAKELPGVAGDEVFLEELEAQQAYFSALRCLAIARSYAVLHKEKEALALLSRASDLSSKTMSHPLLPDSASTNAPNIEVNRPQAKALHELLNGLVIHYRAVVELSNVQSASIAAAAKHTVLPPLIDRLDEYPIAGVDLAKLIHYPPKVAPVSVKPLFLDVAYNYIDYPGRQEKKSSRAVNGVALSGTEKGDKQEGKKGWFGFGR